MKVAPLLLLIAATFYQSVSMAECSASPQQVTEQLYGWYIKSFSDGTYPLEGDAVELKRYVSSGLIQSLHEKFVRPDTMDDDYFFKAQDYFDEWITDMKISDIEVSETTARERVVLAKGTEAEQELFVSLAKENGCWKVIKVEGAPMA